MKVEVDVLGSPYLIALMVSVDVKQYQKKDRDKPNCTTTLHRQTVRLEIGVLSETLTFGRLRSILPFGVVAVVVVAAAVAAAVVACNREEC